MYKLPSNLVSNLNSFNQRKLEKGELFLLALSIADELPLMPPDEDNVNIFVLNHKRFIEEVVWTLNEYTYLDENEIKTLYKLIGSLALWRYNVAYATSRAVFSGDHDSVVDDLSMLRRYIDIVYMCSVGDIVDRANFMLGMFRELVKVIKVNIISEANSEED